MAELDVNSGGFSIHLQGERTQKLWTGDFRAKKRLGHMDRIRKDGYRRELLGANPESASIEASNLAIILSELRVRLMETPEWWTNANNGALLEDEVVLLEIYNKAVKVETDAVDALKAEAEKVMGTVKKTE
jgi:hypothetical protein